MLPVPQGLNIEDGLSFLSRSIWDYQDEASANNFPIRVRTINDMIALYANRGIKKVPIVIHHPKTTQREIKLPLCNATFNYSGEDYGISIMGVGLSIDPSSPGEYPDIGNKLRMRRFISECPKNLVPVVFFYNHSCANNSITTFNNKSTAQQKLSSSASNTSYKDWGCSFAPAKDVISVGRSDLQSLFNLMMPVRDILFWAAHNAFNGINHGGMNCLFQASSMTF